MKILLVHNFYGSSAPSGENVVYLAERDLLAECGHKVIEFTRHSDEIRIRGASGAVQGALSAAWNPLAVRELRRLMEDKRPDVLHAHNTFPLLSPAVFRAARGLRTATVLTLHNYRTFCAAGILMRGAAPCTQCLDRRSVFPALRYGCYRDSRTATLPVAVMIALHRMLGTWQKDVDAFIVLSDFQRTALARAGFPVDRMHIKPHFYPNPPAPVPWPARDARAVFIGRLAKYKGVQFLIDAWKSWGKDAPVLDIIGEGPDRGAFEAQAGAMKQKGKIRFWGQLPFAEAQKRLSRARLLILPSLCLEGFPLVIREALALGVPAAASRLGALPSLIEAGTTGVLFAPGDIDDLKKKVEALWKNPEKLAGMAAAARRAFERRYTAEKNLARLMEIYQKAIAVRKTRLF